jgi:CBS domain-containing protein
MPSKVDWMARGLPMEGEEAAKPIVGHVLRKDVVTAAPGERVREVRKRVESSAYGFALVVSVGGTLLGRLRRGTLQDAPEGRAEEAMEPGPSTLRPHSALDHVVERLRGRNLKTAVVTDPEGRLLGIARLDDMRTSQLA